MIGRFFKFMIKLFVVMFLLGNCATCFLASTAEQSPAVFLGGAGFLLLSLFVGSAVAYWYLNKLITAERDVLRPWNAWYWPPSVLNALYDKLTVRSGKLIHSDGLIFKKEEALPVSKIQNYSAERANIGDIIFGRLTYQIFTAGHAGAEVTLKGYPKVLKTWLERQVE